MWRLFAAPVPLLFAVVLTIWVIYNVFVERQPEFRATIGGVVFLTLCYVVGFKWLKEGWDALQESKEEPPRRRRRRDRADEDEDDRPRRRSRRDPDDEDEDDRPRRRRRRDDD